MTGVTEVQTILDAAADAVVGIPVITKENQRIKSSTVTSFARSTMQSGITVVESIGVGGTDRLNGVYVIDMFYPKDAGIADPNADVDALTVAFEAGTILISGADKVEIFNSSPGATTPDLDKFYRKQVIIEWRARRTRTA